MPTNRPKTSDSGQPEIISRIFSGDISLECFLRDYWQKKPLLIRNAFPDFTSPVSPEELAGLACENDTNARIVLEKAEDRLWAVQYGPFDEQTFERLPEKHWTLLVSDVEKHIPSTRSIIDCFRFIPDWRIDDLMISYAPEGGSVGPHIDAYDVFLLQSYGRRKWMINTTHSNEFLDNTDLKILADFKAENEWIVEPGDVLYLPPDTAHHGVALEPCMTCSIGFRAPSVRSMISEFGEYLASNISSDLRYTDMDIQKQQHPAEISQSALTTIKDILNRYFVTSNDMVEKWFGEYITDTRSAINENYHQSNIIEYDQLKDRLAEHETIQHAPASRFLFIRNGSNALLFIDGNSYNTSIKFSEVICERNKLNCDYVLDNTSTEQDKNTLIEIFNRGCLLL
jgi:50S ribosomal protein L16 3-hydroxylase